MLLLKILSSLVLIYFSYLGFMMLYFELKTRGDNYFALPLAERRRLRANIQKHGRFIYPFFVLVAKVFRLSTPPLMRYQGVTGPFMMSSKKSYRFTKNYQPQSNDIFVATQMKCGTTWMQLVGEKNSRIIKTHMPAELCPHNEKAKYIYVTRHPVSCFASCIDFIHLLAGPAVPDRENMLKWYCSDDMFWRSWPDHVEGWWRRAESHQNVLFVHYESMKNDLPAVVKKVAEFLEMDLSPEEINKVVHRSSFEYMREHEEHFSMFSPNVFSESLKSVRFMQAGTLDRYKDVSNEEFKTIMNFCHARLKAGHYPLDRYYPDAQALPDDIEPVDAHGAGMSNVI